METFNKVILINGTPRSGTTWLGQIIDSSPDVRYKFQPLFSNSFKENLNLHSTKKEIMNFFEEVYNYRDKYLDREKEKAKGIHQRFKNKADYPTTLCIKHVRFHYLLPHLLDQIANLNVCAIIRNPCGTLNSWRKAPKEFRDIDGKFSEQWYFAQKRDKFNPNEYFGFHKWKEATMIFLTLKKWFPNRVYILQYEKLNKNTSTEVNKIFNFAGIQVTQQTTDFINQSTNKHLSDEYSVFKGQKQVDDWKHELNPGIINHIYMELENTIFEQFLC